MINLATVFNLIEGLIVKDTRLSDVLRKIVTELDSNQNRLKVVESKLNAFNPDGSWIPPHLTNDAAKLNSVYYSIDNANLAYKDYSGVVNDLY